MDFGKMAKDGDFSIPILLSFGFYLAISILYALSHIPGWYHPRAQWHTVRNSVHTITEGVIATIVGHPYSGGNLYSIFGAPFVYLTNDLRMARFAMLILGVVTVVAVYKICGWFYDSQRPAVLTAILLLLTPHFQIFSGFALSMIVSVAFGSISMYSYLRFLRAKNSHWAIVSGIFAGISALDHFWGGVTTATIFTIEFAVIFASWRASRNRSVFEAVKERSALFGSHVISLVPAISLYLFYKANGLGSGYGKFMIFESYELLITPFDPPSWYGNIGFYIFEYQPVLLLAAPVAVIFISRFARAPSADLIRVEASPLDGPTPRAFWTIWLLASGLLILFFPYGAYIHEYYLWWSIIPAAGLSAHWLGGDKPAGDGGLSSRGFLGTTTPFRRYVLVALIISSVLLSGLQVSRGYVGPQSDVPGMEQGVPPMCWVSSGGCDGPDSKEHIRDVANHLRPQIGDSDYVAVYTADAGDNAVFDEMYYYLYLMLPSDRYEEVEVGNEIPERTNYIISETRLSEGRAGNYNHIKTVESDGQVSYIYEKSERPQV